MIQIAKDFIQHIKNEKFYAENTCISYQRDIEKWMIFLKQQKIKSWKELKKSDVKYFVITMHNKGKSVKSIRRYLSTLKLLFSYLINISYINNNPVKGINTPKLKKNLVETIDYGQIEAFIASVEKNSNFASRDIAIIELLYSSAIRLSELVGLNVEDIDFNSNFIKVFGKGSKERYTPIGKHAHNALKRYLNNRANDNKALFLSKYNKRLSPRMVEKILENLSKQSDIGIHIYPHLLRHSAATHFLQSSHDLRTVQEFLGHKNIASTQVYTHLDFLELAKTFDKCHPKGIRNKKREKN